MKLGMRAHDFGRMEPSALAKKLRETGFETAQLALTKAIDGINSIDDVDKPILDSIRHAFEENQVEIGVLGCYVEIGYSDKDARLLEVKKFLAGIEHARELGARLIGTETTDFPPDMTKERESAYQNLKDSVLRMVECAEKHNVIVAIETVANHTLNSAELTRRLLDEVNSTKLQVIFDPVNLILTQSDIDNQNKIYNKFLQIVGKDIVALHVKDVVLEGRDKIWRNIGKGSISYNVIFDWLKQFNCNIPILREHVKEESVDADILEIRRLMKGDN